MKHIGLDSFDSAGKAKSKQNENTAGTRTNKIHAVQTVKNKKGLCCEGTGLLHAHKGTRRGEKQEFSNEFWCHQNLGLNGLGVHADSVNL